MKLRDFVVNSLPRVRGKKKSRGNPPPETSGKSRHDTPPRPPVRISSMSRESSVERASHVAVADVNWRHSPPRMGQDDVGLVGSMTYYTPPPGMVMSHSAEGISSHSMALVTSHGPALEYSGPYSQITAISENAVNYSMPRGFVFQSQHHHRHSHQHDYHYVYHHHHHHQYSPDPTQKAPLVENKHIHNTSRCKPNSTPNKPEPGFLRKSFASFKAMRKQRNNVKDAATVKTKPGDENGKCSVCPYPQLLAQGADVKKNADTRPSKPKRKGLKNLRKSKPNQEEQLDKSWFSDNDTCKAPSHHLSDVDLLYEASNQRRRYRECSVESCMSRLYGSQDGSCGPENDFRGLDSHSLSGYESDLPRSKTGRTRSRIKTNPWLPSPQPSLNIGRRFEQSDFRESREDVMTVDDDYPSIPRSASFEHQRPAVLSSFQATSAKGRPVQRHRSLTPSDLKMTLSLKAKPADAQPLLSSLSQPSAQECNEETQMNNLSLAVPKSRPSSILSPASEFIILADNIEQLANNISFEYEDMLESTLESVSPYQEDGKISVQELFTDEELMGSVKNNETAFPNSSQVNATAHSPDSGIGCLGSSDGDELAMANAVSSGQSSPPSSSHCVTSIANGRTAMPKEEIKNSSNDTGPNWNGPENSPDRDVFPDLQNIHSQFSLSPNSTQIPFSFSSTDETGHSGPNSTLPAIECFLRDSSTVGKSTLDNTIRARGLDFTEESSEMNYSPRQSRQSPLQDKPNKAQSHLLKSPFSNSKVSASDTDLVEGPSLIHNKRFNSQSTDLKDFQEEGEMKTFSTAKFQAICGEAMQLPPNIISSELTTPVESPTENWQCDIGYLSQLKANSDDHVLNIQQGQIENPVIDENSGKSLPGVQNSSESVRINTNEKNDELTLPGQACQSSDERLNNTTGSNCLEWVDVSVQTDFNDQDFDSWHESPSEALGDLCNENFDPIESTRRWLLTGNMQGSADTGYSSQPRDSQILMDDDDSILAFDNLNESKTISPKVQTLIEEGTSASKLTCSATSDQSKGDHLEMTTTGGERLKISGELCPLQLPNGKQKSQSGDLIYSMFSGIESQFQDIFHQLWPSQKMAEHTGNKRDSSGSSTSTLISENIGSSSISPAIPSEQSGFDERTPRNSGYESNDPEYVDMKNSVFLMGKKVLKKQKTAPKLEPDYVNVPKKGHSVKSNTGHFWTRSDSKNKDHSGNMKKCSVRSYPPNIDPCRYESKASSPSPLWINKPGMTSTERADYLEFLRDAPLNNTHMKRRMFLIPGFGPIDMSSASVTNAGWTPGSSSQYQTSKGVKTRSSASDTSTVHRVQSLISEGRAGARTKWSHNKEPLGYPSVNKNHIKGSHDSPNDGRGALPDKPKRKNPRALQPKPCSSRPQWNSNQFSDPLCGSSPPFQTAPFQPSSTAENSTRSLAERVWQLQREKDLIYIQLKEVQQEELSRQRQQLQHHRNVHSQRKDVLLETLRELKANLEEQSRKLNLACNKDVYI